MTADYLSLWSTDSIARYGRFFPADIEVAHPQLRNFISTVYKDKLFYVNRYDVYILDIATNERTVLVTIPFEARCLAAAHGWVCVGGETKGDCAFVYIGEQDGEPGNFCHELLVEMLGREIVNSMVVQILKPDVAGYKDETVVLISNNDHTVTIYSLTQRTTLATVEHPQPMNHAVLCPDTTIMAAVGDENKVYFMKRILDESESETPPKSARFANYDWQPLSAPDIPKGDLQIDDFSFAVTFSEDGKLCAASSQGGIITIFDMKAISGEVDPVEDAILCSFRSSRGDVWGCVRSMAFAPAPWKVLAWTEDHGRIGLADLRQHFLRRQHIELSPEKTKKVDLKDNTPAEWRNLDVKERLQRQHQQRMQALRGQPPVGTRPFGAGSGPSASGGGPVSSALSTGETSNLDTMDLPGGVFSINYTSELPRVTSSASRPPSRREYDTHPPPHREYDVQLLISSPTVPRFNRPRRRSSVVLSESQSSGQHLSVDDASRAAMTASPGPMSDDGQQARLPLVRASSTVHHAVTDSPMSRMSTNDLTPTAGSTSDQPLPYNIPPSDPWHVIEASLTTNRTRREQSTATNHGLHRIETAIIEERQLANRLERQLADEQRLSSLLRSELEARERLLDVQMQEMQAEYSGEGEMSPSLERLLQRQLHSERDHTARRSEELEAEIRNMSRRVNQLMDERDELISRQRMLQAHAESSTARSSALPTVLTRIGSHELNYNRMERIDEERRMRAQRIQDLEHEVRRAESRFELAQLQSNVESSRASARARNLASSTSEHVSSTPELLSRILPIGNGRVTSTIEASEQPPLLSPTASAMTRRLRMAGAGAENNAFMSRFRATLPQSQALQSNQHVRVPGVSLQSGSSSNLPSPININDIRTARLMLARASADGNGNWTPTTTHRYFAGGPPGLFGLSRPVTTGEPGSSRPGVTEILRDGGIGTAGIGWSPDGSKL